MKPYEMKKIPPPPPPTGITPKDDNDLIPAIVIGAFLLCALVLFVLAVTGVIGG